jgi:hypothetical protein
MDQFGSLLERPKLYYNIDGVGELSIGFMCLAFALNDWLQAHAPRNSFWHSMYAFVIYMAVMIAIIHYGSKAIKNRITYPRTGFVDYRPRDKYWFPAVAGASVSALLGALIYVATRRHWEASSLVSLLVGLTLAASYIRIARSVRWKWAVFGVVVAGVLVINILPEDLIEAFVNHTSLTPSIPAKVLGAYWLTFVLYGAVSMVSGAISFWLYLRHTQAPAQEGE